MNQVTAQSLQPKASAMGTSAVTDPAVFASDIVTVSVLSLRGTVSPRLDGENKAHIARLAEAETVLPPILVDRRSMRVIDGMHRLMAASLKGQKTVDVRFFDGSAADAFLLAVQSNVTHGLPLSRADRRAAAARIVASHPQMSDRAIGESTGLGARAVATIRQRSSDAFPQLNERVGKDGKTRPLSGTAGRRRAADILAARPDASLREVARGAGVSPATARDVRLRLERGEEPTTVRSAPAAADTTEVGKDHDPVGHRSEPAASAAVLGKLLRDPSLRHNEHGRGLLRFLQFNAAAIKDWPTLIAAVPPHCVSIVVQLARHYGYTWLAFAEELEGRARVLDPGYQPVGE